MRDGTMRTLSVSIGSLSFENKLRPFEAISNV